VVARRGLIQATSTHNLKSKRFPGCVGSKEAGVLEKPAKAHQIGRMVVVIDHHVAHIYHDLGDAVLKMKYRQAV